MCTQKREQCCNSSTLYYESYLFGFDKVVVIGKKKPNLTQRITYLLRQLNKKKNRQNESWVDRNVIRNFHNTSVPILCWRNFNIVKISKLTKERNILPESKNLLHLVESEPMSFFSPLKIHNIFWIYFFLCYTFRFIHWNLCVEKWQFNAINFNEYVTKVGWFDCYDSFGTKRSKN